MRKLTVMICLFSALFFVKIVQVVQADSICSQLILEYQEKFQNKFVIIETRAFQRYGRQQFFVNFIQQPNNRYYFVDKIVRVMMENKNNTFHLKAFHLTDYKNRNGSILDKDQKLIAFRELDDEEISFSKRKKMERIKAGRFILDYYPLPYLGKKYLRNIKRVSDHLYEINKVKVKEGLAVFLDLNELISASYTVEESRIIEIYRDESQGRMIRIIEAGPEIIDFNDLDTLARIAREKLDAYYPLSEKAMD